MNLLQSVLQAVLPSAPTAETFQVQTFPNQFATDPKQIHVLHTNPRRLSVPNDRPATRRTTSSSGSPAGPSPTSRKRRNAAAVFLDKHDHMASDPIEVRSPAQRPWRWHCVRRDIISITDPSIGRRLRRRQWTATADLRSFKRDCGTGATTQET